MKKLAVFSLLFMIIAGTVLSSCVRAHPGCRKNMRKIKKMRKENPNFKV